MFRVSMTFFLVAAASSQLGGCVSPQPEPKHGTNFGLLSAQEGLNQQFTLTLHADVDRPSPYGEGCRDEVSLTAVALTVQDGLADPVKSGTVDVSLWTCLPGVYERFNFKGTAPLLDGDLYLNLPDTANLTTAVPVDDQHVHPELDVRPGFSLAFTLDWTGTGEIRWGASSHVETPSASIDTETASRDTILTGSVGAPPSDIPIEAPVNGTGSASAEWIDTTAL